MGNQNKRREMIRGAKELYLLMPLALLVILLPVSANAQTKIKAFVDSTGKVVFSNVGDNTPMPPVIDNTPEPLPPVLPATDLLAEEMPPSLRTIVETISKNHGVDPALVRAVMKTESNFNRWAVSNKGALGLMQLIPSTGRRYGVRDFFNAEQNVDGGVQHLKFLLGKFNGNLDLSLAAYNAGENLVEKLGRIPPIPETTNYVRRVRAMYKQNAPNAAPMIAPPVATLAAVLSSPGPGKQQLVRAEEPRKESPKPESKIYKIVDQRGVVHFSNIEPSN
jgi:Transglycosylase SLT domain